MENYYKNFEECEDTFFIEIISLKEESNYKDKYIGKILSQRNKNFRVISYIEKGKNYKYGDIIKVQGKMKKASKARNDRGMDYSLYLKTKKIAGTFKIQRSEFIKRNKNAISIIYDIKDKLINSLDEDFEEDEASVLKAILIGENGRIDEETKFIFENSNLLHILAISGFHVSYIIIFLEFVLKKSVKNIKIRSIVTIVFLIFFMFFVGLSPSVMRASLMAIFTYLASIFLREKDFFISFFASLFIILLINPYNIFSISMWLSFMGMLGIVLFSKFIKNLILKKVRTKNKFFINMIEVIAVSISAQIMIFPISLYNFGTISISFFISNLLVSELIAPVLIFGYIYLLIFPIRKIILPFGKILLRLFLNIVLIASKIPLNKFYFTMPSIFMTIVYYVFIFDLIRKYRKNSFKFLKSIIKFKNFKPILIKIGSCILIICIIFSCIYVIPKNLRINFLDVGQGDCTLICTKYNKTILVDAGNREGFDYGKNVVLPYLLSHNIWKLDFLIISHFDSDHCGGAFYLLENMKVENIVIGIQTEKYENCIEFMKIAKKKNVNVIVLKSGDTLKIDKETQIETIFPDLAHTVLENSINNNSLVIKLVYKKFKMLFTGDIEEEAEGYIAEKYKDELKANILKVAHHGSKTSSTKSFVECVQPQIALIGVGENNNFGHPNEKVLEQFKKHKVQVLRTDKAGEISIYTDGYKINFKKTIVD